MIVAVLSGFVLAALVPLLSRVCRQYLGWCLAILPLSLTAYFASLVPLVGEGAPVVMRYAWMPALSANLDFLVDGLSLLFALLVSGIGTFIFIYAGRYLAPEEQVRFYIILLAFMASMLGLVLSDNLITLFVFWELTSITSYLLIGFNHEQESARKAALQGLFVTVAGGLALMAGMVLLGLMAGSFSLSEILSQPEALQAHPWCSAALICIALGAFSKSAQFPFHFWLPNAMAAPTPVSAYLHSATMVKAGVFLLARLNPALGESGLWQGMLLAAGAATLLLGGYLAYSSTGLKKVLAYSTVMALGMLTLLLGIGSDKALLAFVSVLLAHSLYKGSLFMLAGAIDHATGCKDLLGLGGLRRSMPITAGLTILAALSLAGLPPLFGFIAKELFFEALLADYPLARALLIVALGAAALGFAIATLLAIKPFFGGLEKTPKTPHEPAFALLLGPAVLSSLALLFGLLPMLATPLVQAATQAVSGSAITVKLALWHGVNLPLMLSICSIAIGVVLYLAWSRLQPHLAKHNQRLSRWGPEAGYEATMRGIVRLSKWQVRLLQHGVLGLYLWLMVAVTFGLSGYTLLTHYGLDWHWNLEGSFFYEWGIALLMGASAVFACVTYSRLSAVASLGVLGFAVALVFIMFSAPDLGITQLLVETLTVMLLVLVLFKLPEFVNLSSPWERARDLAVALFAGTMMVLLMLAVLDVQYFPSISEYYLENSAPLAYGRNIVNVILVDFRALDTLGEIFVLALAALGVFAMLKLKAEDQHQS